MPHISVVMAVYNAERYLRAAIESVLAQTYGDWELLLVDDGSTDGSTEIARRYAEQQPGRIRYLCHPEHENRGTSAARNLGISHARGEYIAELDADDIWEPQRFEKQLAFLRAHPEVALLGTWYTLIDGQGAERSKVDLPCEGADLRWALLFYCPFVHSGVIWRREPVLATVGFYNEAFSYSEDYEFWTRIARAFPVANLAEYLVRYRVHDSSKTSTYGEKTLEGRQVRTARIARLLGWDEADAEQSAQKQAGIAALYFERPVDPDVLLGATADLLRLHAAFCEAEGLSPEESVAHHQAVRTGLARFLVLRASGDASATGAQRRALLRRAFEVFPAIYLRPRTVLRAAAALLKGLPRGRSMRTETARTGASRV